MDKLHGYLLPYLAEANFVAVLHIKTTFPSIREWLGSTTISEEESTS
jgi:hypothetical protein